MEERFVLYSDILAHILFVRCSFIVMYRFLHTRFSLFKRSTWMNSYCLCGIEYPNVFRIWGLSFLWLIVYYYEYIEPYILEVLKCLI